MREKVIIVVHRRNVKKNVYCHENWPFIVMKSWFSGLLISPFLLSLRTSEIGGRRNYKICLEIPKQPFSVNIGKISHYAFLKNIEDLPVSSTQKKSQLFISRLTTFTLSQPSELVYGTPFFCITTDLHNWALVDPLKMFVGFPSVR